jgi:hypothetical protein
MLDFAKRTQFDAIWGGPIGDRGTGPLHAKN